jgi:hypothetical protein
VAFAIVLALHFGSPLEALAAGMGAVGAAPPSLVGTYRLRLLASIAAALGMSSAAYIAAIAGEWTPAIVLAVTGSAYIYGLLSSFGEPFGAVGLQALLASIILGNIGTPMSQVGNVALAVLGGGLLQALLLALMWPIERHAGEPYEPPAGRASWFGRHPLRVALTVALAMLIFRLGHIERGYWIALTVAIVLRPDYGSTFTIGIARIGGTIIGSVLAWCIAMLIPATPAAHAAAAIGFAALGFVVFRVGPAYYGIAITGFVISLLTMVGLSETTAVVARILATLIGGALALMAFAFWPRDRLASASDVLRRCR